jgi:hypothetical protein
MADPRQAVAAKAGPRSSRRLRVFGWAISVIAWAAASEARPLLAFLSVAAAAGLRCLYVVVTGWGKSRSTFWSPWFFVVAAGCELVWIAARH